jgi:hypothetical protein
MVRSMCVVGALVASMACARAAEWAPLFNGEDLTGWHTVGGAEWTVADDGCVIGAKGDGSYGWLVTDQSYADFVFEVQFRIEEPGNSGIQFRSHVIEGEMFGYQADIYPPDHAETGSVYEEGAGGRGFLAHAAPEVRDALRLDGWNTYRIAAVGSHITLTLNDVVAVDFDDDRTPRGIIALQVHSGEEPNRILWRGARIQDLGIGDGFAPIFDGEDLAGWVEHGQEKWSVVDGAIEGQAVTDQYGYLATEQTYQDFEICMEFRCEADGNSGLFFHSTLEGVDIRGVQCEIDPTPMGTTAGLYESGGRGWLAQPDDLARKIFLPRDWNEMRVRCIGNRTTTWLNGWQVVDLVDEQHTFTDGVIALQLHSGGNAKVCWRELYVRPVAGGEE